MLHRVRYVLNPDGSVKTRDSVALEYIRIQPYFRARQNGQGAQFFSKWKVFFDPDTDIEFTDLLELEGKEYAVLEIYRVRDRDDNINHLEVLV
ncbi:MULTISPECIES: hypothetical protein [Leptospira]|uniref:hypothetical protein n=1 Tax=Leptospira TaxID=171 RepID=UPI000C29C894|nr:MULTISPECIES: hypothetical protein [Leptospira]PJZ87930.1 hypothetical protein CH368_14305 [Leptospira levettii]TGN08626.1 hypothetical protein EHR07_03665 [Leptospira bandrabouensis]